ncbi:hypothetical protein BSPWISOXPB_8571 [uncultured Gammaproteobacteria bacterium]|nr:hypothetical protein BSPWISOXPB_8571 [uncultured Gammaproteobacteria bacterium]
MLLALKVFFGIISQYLPYAVFLPQSKNKNQKNAQTPTGIMISTKKQFHLLGETKDNKPLINQPNFMRL